MLRINKKGDEPILWVLIGIVCFILVAISVLTFIGSIKDNSLVYKKLYSTDISLTKELLENTDENTLVFYKISMFDEKNDGTNPNQDKKLYFEMSKNKVSIKENPIETGISSAYYDNQKIENPNSRFDVDKSEMIYLMKTETDLSYGKTSEPENNINDFRTRMSKKEYDDYKKRNIVIFCIDCKDTEKAFAEGLKNKLSYILDRSVGSPVILDVKYTDIYSETNTREKIMAEYKSSSIIILNANGKNNLIYLDYFSSVLARDLKLNMEKNGINYEFKDDLMLFDSFKISSADKGFFLVMDLNSDTIAKKDSFYYAFDFLKEYENTKNK